MKPLSHLSSNPTIAAISSFRTPQPANSRLCGVLFQPFSSASIKSSAFRHPRLRTSQRKTVELQRRSTPLLVATSAAGDAEPSNSHEGATVDINLPRRSLLVQFTCDDCGERTQRLINRLAYERGLVYVQCAGCKQYHKLADNLGLVVDYDLREEIKIEPNADEV
ncbi:DNL-type zinc finger protein [Linum perenne]